MEDVIVEAIEREVTVPAPPDEVWPVVTDSRQVSAWFGADVQLDPRPGGRAVFRWPDGAERHAVVETVEPARRLAFRWLPFHRTAEGHTVTTPSTRVEITLDAVPAGTRVRVVERRAFSLQARGRRRSGNELLAAARA